jgi:zinc/manganese transport system substrate-binding protein
MLLALWAGILAPGSAPAKLNVVVTTPDLAAVARAVGGTNVEITTLARSTEDPHFVDPRPSFIVKLNRADALIEGGAELELGWLPPLVDKARNRKLALGAPGRIVCHEGIQMLEVPGSLDRSQGDLHALGNPHYLMDPANARIVARHLAQAFSQLDAPAAEAYQANLRQFVAELDAKLEEWRRLLGFFPGRRIVSYHNSWPYFSQRFGVKVDLFLEPKPGIPPSPAHLAQVIGTMKSEQIRVIFVEPFVSRRTAELVARETGARILEVSQFPGGVKGTEAGYVALMDYLVRSLEKTLAETR